jgi:hypothetical protein
LSRALCCIRVMSALAAVAILAAGCAAANNATSNLDERPYQTSYGISSAGTTTNLYSELFGSQKSATAPATVAAAAEPAHPASASQPTRPATAATAGRAAKPAPAQAASRQVQPAPAPVEVAQPAAAPQASKPPNGQ